MKQSWIQLAMNCPDCKVEVAITEIAYSADGEWRFSGKCHKCQGLVWIKHFATYFAHQALCNDLERVQKPKPIIPVGRHLNPPLALPPPVFTDADKKWEREMGINPDEES